MLLPLWLSQGYIKLPLTWFPLRQGGQATLYAPGISFDRSSDFPLITSIHESIYLTYPCFYLLATLIWQKKNFDLVPAVNSCALLKIAFKNFRCVMRNPLGSVRRCLDGSSPFSIPAIYVTRVEKTCFISR